MHFSVFLYQYITLLASLIYFWKGGLETPKTPLDPPLYTYVAIIYVASYIANYSLLLRYTLEVATYSYSYVCNFVNVSPFVLIGLLPDIYIAALVV